jgi:hypothetical protein
LKRVENDEWRGAIDAFVAGSRFAGGSRLALSISTLSTSSGKYQAFSRWRVEVGLVDKHHGLERVLRPGGIRQAD